jgi:hypothetical protein
MESNNSKKRERKFRDFLMQEGTPFASVADFSRKLVIANPKRKVTSVASMLANLDRGKPIPLLMREDIIKQVTESWTQLKGAKIGKLKGSQLDELIREMMVAAIEGNSNIRIPRFAVSGPEEAFRIYQNGFLVLALKKMCEVPNLRTLTQLVLDEKVDPEKLDMETCLKVIGAMPGLRTYIGEN